MTTNDLNAQLQEIAESRDSPEFPPTLSTADLLYKTFTITNTRIVDTQNGPRFIADIELDGEQHEAWLHGKKLTPQVELVTLNLPQTVLLTKGEGDYDPYIIQLV